MSDLLFSLLLLLLLSLFFITNSNCYSLDSTTTICPMFSCGNGPTIRYPFWENNYSNTDYCGYPQFGLFCSSATREPMIKISNYFYYVKNISYSDYTLTLVDADIAYLDCPRARHNISLDSLPLNYSPSDLNLTFYFNCTALSDDKLPHIECLVVGNDGRRSYVFVMGKELDGYNWSENCVEKVVTTVMEGEININDLVGEFDEAMKEGFMLNWKTAAPCGACEKNGGRCGYSYNRKRHLCYCKNGDLSFRDCKGSGFNLPKKLFVGFGAMGVTIILMLAIFFIHQRRNKKRYVGSSYVSRNISSDYSSMTDLENMGNFFGLHIFTYDELEEATDNFDASKELGDGGFGVVYYGKLKDGRVVAVKRLYENNYKRVEQFMNEVAILTRLRHQNLVSLYGCTSRRSQELLLVYEYIPNGTVADHLHGERAKPGSLPWPTRLKIAIETASALTYLHACDIIHRDVKTNNILLDNNFCVKVADFGLSRLFPTDVTHVSTAPQGTPGYVDPDYHQCYQLTDKSDVYSFGVVMIELISSKPAVDITRHRHEINLSNMAINKIQNRALHELVDLSLGFESDSEVNQMITAVAGLAFQCLQSEKDLRPSMEEVLESLKGIQSEVQNVEKPEEVHTPADDAVLLKNVDLARSPDSVTVKWMSSSTTPNASG